MAFSTQSLLLTALLFFFLFFSPSIQAASFRPKALVLPVSKDASTNQYVTQIKQRTPLVPVKLTLDVGGVHMWVDCEKGYVSSSYKLVRCHSAQCYLAGSKSCGGCYGSAKPGCHNHSCWVLPSNTITHFGTSIGELAQDVVSLQSTDGKNPGKVVYVKKFLFTCSPTSLLEGLAMGIKGIAGLGRTKVSMPSQFAVAFSFHRKFAICLSSTSSSKGVVIFGDGPYSFLPGIDVSKSLTYTPLILNPVSIAPVSFIGEPSAEYFIGVKGIAINRNAVRLNKTLLSIYDKQFGFGGTKISTTTPYTIMETSIYKAIVNAFVKELSKVPRVAAVAPFSVCYNANSLGRTRIGPEVPLIGLVLQNKDVVWRIFGTNSMVDVGNDVLCLGFVDGGLNPTTSIVIGGHQLEDNLLQFDLAASRLGFTSSLLFRSTTCSNFNFTSNA